MSIREMVFDIQREVRDTDLQPSRAAELLSKLSALIGNVNAEIREADVAFNFILLAALETHDKANRAKIYAETTPEYLRKREARDTKELVIEMIGTLKYVVRAASEEMRLAR